MDEASKLRYLKEVDYFSSKLENDPGSKVFLPLALAYLRLGKFDEAITVCQSGLDHNPDYVAAKTIMAQAFLGKGLKEEAKGLLIEVATLNSSNYKANKLLGDIYRSEENFEKALYYYRTALQVSPEDNTLRMLIEELAEVSNAKPVSAEDEKEEISEEVAYDKTDVKAENIDNESFLNEAEELSEELDNDKSLEMDFNEIDEKINEFISNQEFDSAKQYVNDILSGYPEILSEKLLMIENASSNQEEIEIEIPDVEDDIFESSLFEKDEELNIETDIPSEELSFEDEMSDKLTPLTDMDSFEDEPGKGNFDKQEEKNELPEQNTFDISDEDVALNVPDENNIASMLTDEDVAVVDGELPDFSSESEELLEQIDNLEDNNDITDDEIDDLDDKVEKKIASLNSSEESYENDENKEVIEELENWLNNIKTMKSKKNV